MPVSIDSEDVQSFERRSGSYEASFVSNFIFDLIQKLALKAVPGTSSPASVLDIGCGTGRLLRKASKRWPTAALTGVDAAEGMVNEARRLTPMATFYQSLAEELPLPDSSMDLVTSTMSFHHWQDQQAGVKQTRRVLRPGGAFVLVDVCLPFGLRKIFGHGHQQEPSALREMFAQAGLDVVSQRRVWARFLVVTVGMKT